MKTIVLIPTEPAPSDPEWLIKKHAGHKLTPEESKLYDKYISVKKGKSEKPTKAEKKSM
jgi:hypothetical protein